MVAESMLAAGGFCADDPPRSKEAIALASQTRQRDWTMGALQKLRSSSSESLRVLSSLIWSD